MRPWPVLLLVACSTPAPGFPVPPEDDAGADAAADVEPDVTEDAAAEALPEVRPLGPCDAGACQSFLLDGSAVTQRCDRGRCVFGCGVDQPDPQLVKVCASLDAACGPDTPDWIFTCR